MNSVTDAIGRSKGAAKNNKYMSVAEMGDLLGLKKTDRYYLLHKGLFETTQASGKTWVDVESFEKWYERQDRYTKVTGEKPGKKLREQAYSVRDIMEILDISKDTARYIIDKNQFHLTQTGSCMRVSKEEFDGWYVSQKRYFNAADRIASKDVRTSTISMPQMASLLEVNRHTVYSILADPRYRHIFEIRMLGEQKRITLKSFLAFLNIQNEYQLSNRTADPAVDRSASESPDTPGRTDKNSIFPVSEYLTVNEASVLAEVSRSMIVYWIERKHFSHRKAGRFLRIPTKEFLTWLGTRKGAVT